MSDRTRRCPDAGVPTCGAKRSGAPPPGTLLSAPVGEIALAMGGSTLKPAIFTGTALFMMRDVLPFMDGRR